MHNAPSVSYPVGRCAFQRQLYLFLLLVTLAVLGAWALNLGFTRVWWAAALLAMVGGVLGALSLLRCYAKLERPMLVFARSVWYEARCVWGDRGYFGHAEDLAFALATHI